MSSAEHVEVGSFALEGLLGRGGMGEVWRARHRSSQQPVAIKVLTAVYAHDPDYLEAFAHEARAVAGLDHPGVVPVLDYGRLPDRAGPFATGSPYLVMPLLPGGTLRNLTRPEGPAPAWPTIRATLAALLDALAHVHARHIVHRDLKPGNVLLDTEGRPVLTDFGVAQAGGDALHGARAGTLQYMAPEQIEGLAHLQGPWTDLYALGCLTFALVHGEHAFDASSRRDLALAKLAGRRRRWRPRVELPAGLEDWVDALIARDIDHRIRLAADALARLAALEDETTLAAPRALPQARATELLSDDARHVQTATGTLTEVDEEELRAALVAARSKKPRPPVVVPPCPEDWRPADRVTPVRPLAGTGLGLYGLRAIPLVDRDDERDALWARLAEVWGSGHNAALILRGPAGVGKSRLARWLCERGYELGAATSCRGSFARAPDPGSGLAPMLARLLGLDGLDPEDALVRAAAWLRQHGVRDVGEARALVGLTHERSDARMARFAGVEERHALLERVLGRVARDRPLIVWLDDVQWGPEALLFVARALLGQPRRLLFVLTARDDALAEAPRTGRLLSDLAALPRATALDVGPLPPEDRQALVRVLLGVSSGVVAQVAARTGGNPLFAIELVGDWVRRGILAPTSGGFIPAEGASLELPENLAEVWRARLERALEPLDEPARIAVERAAALGVEVALHEWRAVAPAGADTAGILEDLARERLVVSHEGGARLSFVHGMLREAVLARAADAGRLAAHHAVCADHLATLDLARGPERRGRHLSAAGRPREALPLLRAGIRGRIDESAYGEASALLRLHAEALDAAAVPQDDPARLAAQALRAEVDLALGETEAAEAGALEALERASNAGLAAETAAAGLVAGRVARNRGDFEQAWQRLEAAQRAASHQHTSLAAEIAREMGYVLMHRGQLDPSVQWYQRARAGFERVGDELGVAHCVRALGVLSKQRGDLDEARAHVLEARRRFLELGFRTGAVSLMTTLGELSRMQGDRESAEGWYKKALAGYRAIGSGDYIFPWLNLGVVQVEREEWPKARETLLAVLEACERQGRGHLIGAIHVCLLPPVAAAEDWQAWARHFEVADRFLADSSYVDVDIARMAERAGLLAAPSNPDAAHRVYALAEAQWRALGRTADLERVQAAVAALPKPGER